MNCPPLPISLSFWVELVGLSMQLNTIEKKNHSHQRAQPACKLLYKSQIDEDTHRDHVVVFLKRLGVIHPRSRQ
jgi:hypothetical protein